MTAVKQEYAGIYGPELYWRENNYCIFIILIVLIMILVRSLFNLDLVSLTQLFEIEYNRISSWKILRNLNREKRCQN